MKDYLITAFDGKELAHKLFLSPPSTQNRGNCFEGDGGIQVERTMF